MNRSISLIRYAKTDRGWRRGAVVIGKNGKLKPDTMILSDEEVYCPNGRFQLVRYEGSRAIYTDLGNDPQTAMDKFRAEESKQAAKVAAVQAGILLPEQSTEGRKTLKQYADAFLAMHKALPHRSDDMLNQYTFMTKSFLERCPVTYPDQLNQEHVIGWCGYLQEPKPEGKDYADRSRANYYMSLRGFLRYCDVDPKKLIDKGTHKLLKSYTKKAPNIYDPKVIDKLIAAANSDRIKLCWEFGYKVGPRDSELQMVTRHDFYGLGTKNPNVHIKERDEYGNIKDKEERVIELESGLAKRIQAYLKKYPDKVLLFGTENDQPDGHLLRTLKRCARRAGLNCGICKGCKGKHNECREYTLHRFRRTYTSRMLVATHGDLRGVMARTGHSQLESVIRYLAPVSNVREALRVAF